MLDAALGPNSLPSATWPYHLLWFLPGHRSVPSGPQECGSRPKLGFEEALLSPRVASGLSETLLHPCFIAEG